MDTEPEKTIIKGAGFIIISLILSKLINYAYNIIVARGIGPEAFGELNIGIAIISIGGVISLLGVGAAAERFIGYYLGKNDKIKSVIGSSFLIVIPASLILGLAIYYFSNLIATKVFEDAYLTNTIKLFSLGIPVFAILEVMLGIFRGVQNAKYTALVKNIFESLLRLALTIAFILLGFGVFGASLAYVLSLIFAVILALYLLIPTLKVKSKTETSTMIKKIVSYSWPLTFSGILFILVGKIDTLMLGHFMEVRDVGIYNAALAVSGILMLGFIAITTLFMSVSSNLYSKNDLLGMSKLYSFVTKWTFFMTTPIFFLFILFPKMILNLFFGEVYTTGYLSLIVLSIGLFFTVIFGPANNLLEAFGKTKIILVARIVSTVYNIIMNIVLIPILGILGAAIATGSSLLILKAITVIVSKKQLQFKLLDIHYLKALIALIPMFVVALIFYLRGIVLDSIVGVIVLIAVMLVLYALLLLPLRVLNQEERNIAKDLFKEIRGKLNFRR